VYNEKVTYECATGFSVDATPRGDKSFSTTCQANGQYGEVSECHRVNCGEPDEIPNGGRPSGSLVFEDKIKYTCFDGFTLDATPDGPTSFDVECHEDGKNSKVRSCLPKICGEPPTDINVRHASTANEGTISYPRITEVTCEDGYTIGGDKGGNTSFIVSCKESGHFQRYDPRECEPVRCGEPPIAKNATLQKVLSLYSKKKPGSKILNYGERAVYECLPGFTTGGEPNAPTDFSLECLPSGEFSAPPLDMQCRNVNDCEENTCGPKGMCVDLIGPAPAYTCDCDYGFELMTRKNGDKHCGNTDDCKDQDCGHGICKDMIGDYTCICPSGYYQGDKDGLKTCLPVRCSEETPRLENGMQLTNNHGPLDFPTTVRYECDEGYSIDATVSDAKRLFQAQCKSNGQLVGMSTCRRITCGTARVLPFTKVTSPSDALKAVRYQGTADYECFEGYTLDGKPDGKTKFSVTCKKDGIMTEPKVCEPIVCGQAPAVPKSRAAIAGVVMYGMHLEYLCDIGYSLDNTLDGEKLFARSCHKDASFSKLPSPQPCQPITAGKAPSIQYASMSEYAGKPIENFPPTVYYPNGVEYRCSPGYSENGLPTGPTKIVAKVNSQATFTPAEVGGGS
jgi:hypothetical protein